MAYRTLSLCASALLFASSTTACGDPPPGDESGTHAASTSATDSTSVDPSTGAPVPTTGTGSADTTVDPPPGTTGTTGAETTAVETTADSTTDAETTSAETTGDGTTGDTGETTGASDDLVLDPATLEFFELPIGSLRHAVAGFDPLQQTCVSIIFHNAGEQQHCDDFVVGDSNGFPYVIVTPAAAPPCMEWDYAGNVQLDAATGCMQVLALAPVAVAIDMQLTVSGAPFTGTISVASE